MAANLPQLIKIARQSTRNHAPPRALRQVLSHRQGRALIITILAKLGPPWENVRQTLDTCWKIVLRAAAPAHQQLQHRRRRHRRRHHQRRHRRRALIIMRCAKLGPTLENVTQTPDGCWKTVLRVAVSALDQEHRHRRRRQGRLRHPLQAGGLWINGVG